MKIINGDYNDKTYPLKIPCFAKIVLSVVWIISKRSHLHRIKVFRWRKTTIREKSDDIKNSVRYLTLDVLYPRMYPHFIPECAEKAALLRLRTMEVRFYGED